MYNILEDIYVNSTSSGVLGFDQRELTQAQTEALSEGEYSFTLTSGSFFGVVASMGMDIVCREARIYCDSATTASGGFAKFLYKEYLTNEWKSHGDYNYNTDYATPMMMSNLYPEPYECDQTSAWSNDYKADKAFNQTADDANDCWHTDIGAGYPQSIMFYFPYGKVINKYALQSRNSGTDRNFPRDFELQGNTVADPDITNDSHWETLDSRENVVDPGQGTWSVYFTFENIVSYTHYRLLISDSNSSSSSTAIANIKLVEANRAESVPISNWYEMDMTWSGGYYSCVFDAGVEEVGLYMGSFDSGITVSGVALYTADDIVVVSGTVASGIYVDNYSLTHRTLSPLLLRIQNNMEGWATPHVVFKYTGVYDVDRNVFISPDYARSYNKDDAKWYGVDHGYTAPELDSFERGVFDDTTIEERCVVLQSDKTEGSWRSPVIDTNNKDTSVYVYTQGNDEVYVRASDTPPPVVNFLITATDPTHRWLMYDHKRVYIDSNGETIGSSECDPPADGNKIWRWADHDWAATDLMYYGSINEFGTACFVAPGYLECADISPEQEWEMPEYWYNCSVCKIDDDSEWGTGTTISGLPTGENVMVAFTKTFPVEGSNGFFCFTVTSDENSAMSAVNLSFHQDGVTLGSYPLITMMGSLTPGSKVDVAYDAANNGWWVYLGYSLYKVDPGSINNIRVFGRSEVDQTTGSGYRTPDTLQGYIWKYSLDTEWKGIVSIPSTDYSYFWAYTNKKLYLYEEKYDLDEVEIVLHATIEGGYQIDSGYLEFHQGSCDSDGNIWMLDMAQERVIRVGLQKALKGDPRMVEYENQIAGVIGLWAHPTDGTCYLLISDEPEHPNQDIIRMVHANQRWGAQGKYVCAVPGFCSESYRYGVSFVGKAFESGVRPHDNDTNWGRYNLESDGASNTSTAYATPEMYSTSIPKPYKVIYSSELGWSDGYAWEAFGRQVDWMLQYAKDNPTINGSTTIGWSSSEQGSQPARIGFVFDEPTLINKYAFALPLSGPKYGLVEVKADRFPVIWELHGVKDEYADDPDITNDSHWELIEYRRVKEEELPYLVDTEDVDPDACDPWTSYFTCYNSKPRKAYRFYITHSWLSSYSGDARWNPYTTYVIIGEIKLVAAQEKLSWHRVTTGRSAPRGRYKQVRVDFSRENVDTSSPKLEKLRMPMPIEMEPVSKGQDCYAALKTTFNKVRTPSSWDTKLKVWWFDEGI